MLKIIKYASVQKEPVIIESAISIPIPESDEVALEEDAVDFEAVRSEMLREAQAVLDDAKKQADRCAQEAVSAAEEIKQQAREEGYNAGYQDGIEQGHKAAETEMKQQLDDVVEKAQFILSIAEQEARETILEGERQIVELALAIAGKVLAREMQENPMIVLPIVRAALEKVRDQEPIVIRVNPQDYDIVLQAKRDLSMLVGREQAINIVADYTVGIGGCVVDSPYGVVDATLDTQLEALKEALREAMP